MNPVTTVVLSVALLLGAAGAVFAYDSGAHSMRANAAVSRAAATATADAVRPARHRGGHHRTVVRWAPCPDGTALEDGVCVTDVVRTVTLPAAAAPAVSHNNNTAGATQHSSGGDDGDDDGDEHGDEHGDDD